MIGIIDYGMGNLRSVQKAFEHIGAEARILTAPAQIPGVDKLVLPGVGAFGDGMIHLDQMGWTPAIKNFVATGKTFLGICLGMQLVFESSEEGAAAMGETVPGLGLLKGKVRAFTQPTPPAEKIKIPHMGWNTLDFESDNPLFQGLDQDAAVYFVHGYYVHVDAAQPGMKLATTDYGSTFCSAVCSGNIHATQFHPEKSQRVGLRILTNFHALP